MDNEVFNAIVTASHNATYAQAVILTAGDTVAVGAEDIDFPGWVWCTDSRGISGWVPKAYLEIDGESGKALRDYSARELTVQAGQRLTVLDEESSWYMCETESGERGWVPVENVRSL